MTKRDWTMGGKSEQIEEENRFLDNYDKFRNKRIKKVFGVKDRSDIYILQTGKHL